MQFEPIYLLSVFVCIALVPLLYAGLRMMRENRRLAASNQSLAPLTTNRSEKPAVRPAHCLKPALATLLLIPGIAFSLYRPPFEAPLEHAPLEVFPPIALSFASVSEAPDSGEKAPRQPLAKI